MLSARNLRNAVSPPGNFGMVSTIVNTSSSSGSLMITSTCLMATSWSRSSVVSTWTSSSLESFSTILISSITFGGAGGRTFGLMSSIVVMGTSSSSSQIILLRSGAVTFLSLFVHSKLIKSIESETSNPIRKRGNRLFSIMSSGFFFISIIWRFW